MPKHIVKQGECLATIARKHGVSDAQAIYDDPANAELRRRRPNSGVLAPGDEVALPAVQPKAESCSPGKVHALSATLPRKKLQLALRTPGGQPLAGVEWKLRARGKEQTGKTTANGLVEALVDVGAEEAELVVGGGMSQLLAIGHLNPMKDTADEGVSGVQGRLRNLGHDVPVDGVMGPLTCSAIRAYQRARRLEETGKPSDALFQKLQGEHGC